MTALLNTQKIRTLQRLNNRQRVFCLIFIKERQKNQGNDSGCIDIFFKIHYVYEESLSSNEEISKLDH